MLIPVLNEEKGLEALIAALTPHLDALGLTWSILFVDDGSTDGTADKLRSLNARDKRFTAISFSRNFGKEIALAAGLKHVSARAVVIMDADLQHPPEVIGAFVAKWREGYQVVYGQRIDRHTDGFFRRLYSRTFYRLFNVLADTDLPEGAGDFRLLDRRAIDAMNSIRESSRFNKGLFSWIGFRSIGVPFKVAERTDGVSRWRFRRLASFALDGLTSFSTVPLRVWSLLGVIISAGTILYALSFAVGTLIFGSVTAGFPTIFVSVLLLSGVQLISLGVLGEYLGRVYEEVKARPLYIVAEKIGLAEASETSDKDAR